MSDVEEIRKKEKETKHENRWDSELRLVGMAISANTSLSN